VVLYSAQQDISLRLVARKLGVTIDRMGAPTPGPAVPATAAG